MGERGAVGVDEFERRKREDLEGGGVWGERGLERRLCPSPEIFFDFGSQIGRIFVQTGCFLYSSAKAGLNAVPTFKLTLGMPVPGVPAGNDPWFVSV